MSSGGDYVYYRQMFADRSQDTNVASGDTTKTDIATLKNANYRLYIQRIAVMPFTYSDKTWTFQDDGTPLVIGHIDFTAAAPENGVGQPIVLDFGSKGRALATGKNLDISLSGAGVAASVHVECYERMEGVTYANAGASLQ